MDTPTISLSIRNKQDNTLLATIEGLPVPIHLEPEGDHTARIRVLGIEPVMQAALDAFTQAWEHACKEATT